MSPQRPTAGPASMRTPRFFDDVARIRVIDPLADLLGAAEGGQLDYSYLDAVKLTGHSCPTVAGAYLMTRTAMARLYPDGLPRRGELRVELRQALGDGVAGVIASVAGLITGAANEGGFKGLAGRFARDGLLRFGVPMTGEIRFTRLDTGQAVELSHRPQAVPRPATIAHLMQQALMPDADAAARKALGDAWQGWVRTLLVEHADDPALISVVD